MADIAGIGLTDVGGLETDTGEGHLEYWRPTVETPDGWVSSTLAPTIFTSQLAWDAGTATVRLQVSEEVDFSVLHYNTTAVQNSGVSTGRAVSGLTEGVIYYIRCNVTKTLPSTYVYTSAWSDTHEFIVQPDSGHAQIYLTMNGGVEHTPDDAWNSYLYKNAGVLHTPSDAWNHYLYQNFGVKYTPSGYIPQYTFYGDVTTDTPTPVIWFLRPMSGRPGDGILIYGQGFGDLQVTYTGIVEIDLPTLGWTSVPINSWQTFPATVDAYTGDREMDQALAQIDPQHTIIEIVVPTEAIAPGHPIRVRTDGA